MSKVEEAAARAGIEQPASPGLQEEEETIREDATVDDVYEREDLFFAQGISGKVYKGRHRETGEEVAIKEIIFSNPRLSRERRIRKEAEAEIMLLLRIKHRVKHPAVMVLKEAFLDEDRKRFFLVMPMCKGGELFDYVASTETFCERTAAKITRKLAEALKALHANGIVHRDIKPENILLRRKSDPTDIILTDFGLAKCKQLVDLHDRKVVGTQSYIAPEVYKEEEATDACDVWSMGVCLYILLSGIAPFYGPYPQPNGWKERAKNKMVIKQATLSGRFYFFDEFFGSVSEDAMDLIRKCLTIDPAARITVDGVLNHPFLVRQQSTEPLPTDQLGRFMARRKFRAAVAVALIGSRFNVRRDISACASVSNLNKQEVALMRTAFHRVAKNGAISAGQFRTVMQVLGFETASLDRMFELFDADSNGVVDYREMLAGISCLKACDEDTVRMLWQIYDTDGDERISRQEFAKVIAAARPDSVASIEGLERAVDLFELIDTDHNEHISFDEFKAAVVQHPILAEEFLGPVHPSLGVDADAGAPKGIEWKLDTPREGAAGSIGEAKASSGSAADDGEGVGAGAGVASGTGAGAGAAAAEATPGDNGVSTVSVEEAEALLSLGGKVRRRAVATDGPSSDAPTTRSTPAVEPIAARAPEPAVVTPSSPAPVVQSTASKSSWHGGLFFVLGVAVALIASRVMTQGH